MHLGRYRFPGDPDELLPAYDRLMATLPEGSIDFHACVVEADGITVYDACPTREVFERFSTSADFHRAIEAAGLPRPTIDSAPIHAARTRGGVVLA